MKKIQKIKSLNKAIHFLSPSDSSFSFSFSSVSYPKHRGSQMPKSKQKSFLAKKLLARKLSDLSYLSVSVTASTASTTAQSKFTISKNKILNRTIIGTRTFTASATAQSRRITFERTTTGTINMILNRVSNMNSKDKLKNWIKISFRLEIKSSSGKNTKKITSPQWENTKPR